MPASRRIPFQQITVEYRVLGALDGVTPAPVVNFSDPNGDDFVAPNEQGVRVVEVEGNLGLIDPDFNGGAAQGDRCIPWVYLDTDGVAGEADAQFAVLDNVPEEGILTPAAQVAPRFATGGTDVFFSERPTEVPQGSVLGVTGYPSGGRVKIVRVNVVVPSDPLEWAEIQKACCCVEASSPCEPPDITTVDTLTGQTGVPQQFVITGESLGSGPDMDFIPLKYMFVPNPDGVDPSMTPPIQGTVIDNPDKQNATVEVTFAQPGEYVLQAFDPTSPDCNTASNPDFDPLNATIVVEVLCPTGDVPITGDVAPVIGSVNNTVSIAGTNFGSAGSPNVVAARIFNAANVELTVNSISISSDTLLDLDFDADGPLGLYSIELTPADEVNCDPVVLADQITVSP